MSDNEQPSLLDYLIQSAGLEPPPGYRRPVKPAPSPPPAPAAPEARAPSSPLPLGETFPCEGCGKFAFHRPTRCYWCRSS